MEPKPETAGAVATDPNSVLLNGIHDALRHGPLLAKSPAIALAVAKEGGDIPTTAGQLHLLAQLHAWDRAAQELQAHAETRLPSEGNDWGI